MRYIQVYSSLVKIYSMYYTVVLYSLNTYNSVSRLIAISFSCMWDSHLREKPMLKAALEVSNVPVPRSGDIWCMHDKENANIIVHTHAKIYGYPDDLRYDLREHI